ncbi:MAG: hypothetical protein ACTSXJ_10035 [Candidatus Baldrarchaeia archaeon]
MATNDVIIRYMLGAVFILWLLSVVEEGIVSLIMLTRLALFGIWSAHLPIILFYVVMIFGTSVYASSRRLPALIMLLFSVHITFLLIRENPLILLPLVLTVAYVIVYEMSRRKTVLIARNGIAILMRGDHGKLVIPVESRASVEEVLSIARVLNSEVMLIRNDGCARPKALLIRDVDRNRNISTIMEMILEIVDGRSDYSEAEIDLDNLMNLRVVPIDVEEMLAHPSSTFLLMRCDRDSEFHVMFLRAADGHGSGSKLSELLFAKSNGRYARIGESILQSILRIWGGAEREG